MATFLKHSNARADDVRDLLLRAGVGQYNATMALPYVWFTPTTCDPYAQGVMLLVQGLQNILNSKGAKLEVDGGLGVDTALWIRRYSGSNWRNKTWTQLYSDVLAGKPRPAGFQAMPPVATAGYLSVGEVSQQDYCSTLNDNCSGPIAGVCTPNTPTANDAFKYLQNQLNRVSKVKGYSLIDVDGRIGGQTVARLKLVLGISFTDDCNYVAQRAQAFSAQVYSLAQSLGAPATVAPPSSSKPSINLADGTVDNTAARPSFVSDLAKNPIALAALAFGAVLIFAPKKRGKGKRKKK